MSGTLSAAATAAVVLVLGISPAGADAVFEHLFSYWNLAGNHIFATSGGAAEPVTFYLVLSGLAMLAGIARRSGGGL